MIETPFTRLLGIDAPLQAAAMPGVSTPALVAAVAEAGGLGMIPAPMMTPEALSHEIGEVTERTTGAFGVNFLMPFLDPACVEVAARGARVVEFFYGEPDAELIAGVHAHGALASWQVGSAAEAVAARAAGCDLLIAQGTEAGGHVRGRAELAALLPEVREAVEIPILAAGGISTPAAVRRAIELGASGVRIGTRFIASAESGAHPDYIAALIAARASDTCLTEAFSVMWPDAPHRVLRSSIAAAEASSADVVGETRIGDRTMPVPRFSVVCPSKETTGDIAAMALYAGTSVADVREVEPAAAIVRELLAGLER